MYQTKSIVFMHNVLNTNVELNDLNDDGNPKKIAEK